jgi:hypothetical protein
LPHHEKRWRAYIIVNAREFDAQVAPEGTEEGSDPSDDLNVAILEDTPDNPTQAALSAVLRGPEERL